MPSGMESASITYSVLDGIPEKNILESLGDLYEELFDDADLNLFELRFQEKQDLTSILAYHDDTLVGFKIGYRYDLIAFYSWVGGVKKKYRKKGIATKMAQIQEDSVLRNGYYKIRTKSMNRYKPMMALNLKNGFDIIQMYTNSMGQTKIVFEKTIA